MEKVLLLVTWIVSGQPPSSYQATFDSMDSCVVARDKILADGAEIARQSQQPPAGLPANTLYNPGQPPRVTAVCAAQ
jgi:hypothetical protein